MGYEYFANTEEAVAALSKLWLEVRMRQDEDLPRWQDFTPAELAPIAPLLLVTRFNENFDYIVRYAGNVYEAFTTTMRAGSNVSGLLQPQEAGVVLELRRSMLGARCGLVMTREMRLGGQEVYVTDTIIFPLRQSNGQPTDAMTYLQLGFDLDGPLIGRLDRVQYVLTGGRFFDLGYGVPAQPHVELDIPAHFPLRDGLHPEA